jgi:hypothetical protein
LFLYSNKKFLSNKPQSVFSEFVLSCFWKKIIDEGKRDNRDGGGVIINARKAAVRGIHSTIDLLLPTSQVKVCSDSNIFCICEKISETFNFIYALFHYLI